MTDKTFWVIEAPWQPPHYMGAPRIGHHSSFKWTDKIDNALQFSRKQDADALLEVLFDAEWPFRHLVTGHGPAMRITEHAYIAAQ